MSLIKNNTIISENLKLFSTPPSEEEHYIHTTSSLSCFMRCQKLYEYRYELGYRSVDPIPALLVGSATHLGLEYFWKGASCAEAMAHVAKFCTEESYFSTTDGGKIDAIKVAAYIKGYYSRWLDSRELYEVVGVELQFFVPLSDENHPAFHAGKLDVLVRRKSDGQLIIIEHKTAGSGTGADEPGSSYWTKLSMDTQLAMYSQNVFRMTGEMPEILYDVILKSRATPLKGSARKRKSETDAEFAQRKAADAETLPQFSSRMMHTYRTEGNDRYFRKPITLMQDELDLKLRELAETQEVVETCNLRVRNTSACNSYGRACEFMNVCIGADGLDTNPKFRKKQQAHEELETTKEAP